MTDETKEVTQLKPERTQLNPLLVFLMIAVCFGIGDG